MKGRFLSQIAALAAALVVAFAAVSAQAAPIIDFVGLVGGTITDVGGGDFVGTDIDISLLQLIDTPANEGSYAIQDGLLNFDTAANTITITGAIADLGIAQQTLLAGSFTAFNFAPLGPQFAFSATGPDAKSDDLLVAAGIAPGTPFVFANFAISSRPSATSNVYNTFSTDVSNTPVPEPSSLFLFGSGLLALGFAAYRRTA